tara:strand:+ start:21676 stop:22254 length:579 start_codon:yes stop_codon:yes gene_type:complete
MAALVAFLLLTASVVKHLFFRTPAVGLPESSIVTDNPDPRDLLECNTLVLEQLTNLSAKTNTLLNQPVAGEPANDRQKSSRRGDLASDWKRFSNQWRDEWDVVNARCRFSELAETTMGAAYDRMAHVHEALPAMRLRYNSLLAEFDNEQADELFEMRRALDESRESIQRRIERHAPNEPHASPAPVSSGGLP